MAKVFLFVLITFSDKPQEVRMTLMHTTDECYEQAATLARAPPIDDDVVSFKIGCSFEDKLPVMPL